MKKLIAGAIACAALIASPGAQAPAPDYVVSTEWLAAKLNDPSVVVIVTGERTLFERGHIPGARFIDHMETLGGEHGLAAPDALAAALARAGGRDDARIELYGDTPMATGWRTWRSRRSATAVTCRCSTVTRSLAREGRPTSTTRAPDARGHHAKPAPGRHPTLWVKSQLQSPRRVCPTSAPGGARRASFQDRRWSSGRASSATSRPRSSSRRTRSARPRRRGAHAGQEAVTYCAVGMRASLRNFAANYAGVPARSTSGPGRTG